MNEASALTKTKTYEVSFEGTATNPGHLDDIRATVRSELTGPCAQTGAVEVSQTPDGVTHSVLTLDWEGRDGTLKIHSEGSLPPGATSIVDGKWSVRGGSTGRYEGATGGGGQADDGGGHGGDLVTGKLYWNGTITLNEQIGAA